MIDQKENINLELDAFFTSAKRSVPIPSESLKDKIRQDAQQETLQWDTHTRKISKRMVAHSF